MSWGRTGGHVGPAPAGRLERFGWTTTTVGYPAIVRLGSVLILALFAGLVGSRTSCADVDLSVGFGPHADDLGRTYFVTPPAVHHGGEAALGGGGSAAPFPLGDTFSLHSQPGASKVIYLDFDGHDGDLGYDFDGNHQSFSDAEREEIQRAWQRAAEDFVPFDVDVTTEYPGIDALRKSGGGDQQWGVRVVVHPGAGTSGGWAYVGSFNWSSDQPAYVDTNGVGTGAKNVAEVITHEAGHTLGLSHDGWDADGVRDPETGWDSEYYGGHGSGVTGWAPIMGVGYYQPVTQWSRGEYDGATNSQDDLTVITSQNGFGYRGDDHGSTLGEASEINHLAGIVIYDEGIIERNSDWDFFEFAVARDGPVDLTIDPVENGPNLDIEAVLYDAAGDVVTVSGGTNDLGAELHLDLTAGDYFLRIDGVGTGDPTTAYSDYGSLGYYRIFGTAFSDLAGDINFDGQVDYRDIETFIAGWRSRGHASIEEQIGHGDLNLDGVTDLADWFILRQAMTASGNGSYLEGASIPEPSALLLALIAIGCTRFPPFHRSATTG